MTSPFFSAGMLDGGRLEPNLTGDDPDFLDDSSTEITSVFGSTRELRPPPEPTEPIDQPIDDGRRTTPPDDDGETRQPPPDDGGSDPRRPPPESQPPPESEPIAPPPPRQIGEPPVEPEPIDPEPPETEPPAAEEPINGPCLTCGSPASPINVEVNLPATTPTFAGDVVEPRTALAPAPQPVRSSTGAFGALSIAAILAALIFGGDS